MVVDIKLSCLSVRTKLLNGLKRVYKSLDSSKGIAINLDLIPKRGNKFRARLPLILVYTCDTLECLAKDFFLIEKMTNWLFAKRKYIHPGWVLASMRFGLSPSLNRFRRTRVSIFG